MNRSDQTIAALHGVSRRFGTVLALDQVSLEVRRGEVLALLGPNGAGKTTAISLLLGLQQPDAGSADLFGVPPRANGARNRIGAMLQTGGVPDTLTVAELVGLFRSYYPRPRSVADTVNLAGVADLLRRRYGTLSGGQQRRAQFALAICGDPQILFLDEPTVGLDMGARTALWKTLRTLVAGGCAIVLTTHYLEEAEALADRVAVLARGRIIAAGSVDDIRAHVAQRRIRCISSVAAETLRGWPEVMQAEREGEHLHIVSDAVEAVLRRLLATDPELRDLEVQRAGLAEAFAEITTDAGVPAEQREAA